MHIAPAVHILLHGGGRLAIHLLGGGFIHALGDGGGAKQHSMVQMRTTTLGSGRVMVRGWRVKR